MNERRGRELRVSVIGLGKLGACMAAAIADRGHRVVGYDVRPDVLAALDSGIAPVREPQLQELIARNRDRIRATGDMDTLIAETDLTFVVVPTPSEPSGAFSLQFVEHAFREMGESLARKDRYHVVVLTSTVLPGSTRFRLIPLLEQASGKRCGPDFGVCYSPEFIALGSVIHDFLNPDFTLIGEFDERSGAILEHAYHAILTNGAPSRRMSIENAELSKIALNTYVTTKITFANMLADLCERIPGGDVDVVSDALGLDQRIGRRYLTGAVGFGGPCFPRDNVALSYFARVVGTSADLAETTHSMNRAFVERLVARLLPLAAGRPIGVLGLAYKPHTPVLDESPGLALAFALARAGAAVYAFDPAAMDTLPAAVSSHLNAMPSAQDLLAAVDVVVITTPDPAFRVLPIHHRARPDRLVVLDCWRIAESQLTGRDEVLYYALGRSDADEFNAARLAGAWSSAYELTTPALRADGP